MTDNDLFPLPSNPEDVEWIETPQDVIDALNSIDGNKSFEIKLSPDDVLELLRFGFYITHSIRQELNYSTALNSGNIVDAARIGAKTFASLKMADNSLRKLSLSIYRSIIEGANRE